MPSRSNGASARAYATWCMVGTTTKITSASAMAAPRSGSTRNGARPVITPVAVISPASRKAATPSANSGTS